MTARRQPTHARFRTTVEVEVTVEATFSPEAPGTYWDPPEGGELTDFTLFVGGVTFGEIQAQNMLGEEAVDALIAEALVKAEPDDRSDELYDVWRDDKLTGDRR